MAEKPTKGAAQAAPAAPSGIIDDTEFFRGEERIGAIYEQLKRYDRYNELVAKRAEAIKVLYARDEESARQLDLVDGWLEQFMLEVCVGLIREAKAEQRKKGEKR